MALLKEGDVFLNSNNKTMTVKKVNGHYYCLVHQGGGEYIYGINETDEKILSGYYKRKESSLQWFDHRDVNGFTKGEWVIAKGLGSTWESNPLYSKLGYCIKGAVNSSNYVKLAGSKAIIHHICYFSDTHPRTVAIIHIPGVGYTLICIDSLKKTEQPQSISNQSNQISHEQTNKTTVIKVDRLVSRIRTGQRPSGNAIRGRTSKSTVESRRVSYSASIVKS